MTMKTTTNATKNQKFSRKVREVVEDIYTISFSLKTLSMIHWTSSQSQWEDQYKYNVIIFQYKPKLPKKTLKNVFCLNKGTRGIEVIKQILSRKNREPDLILVCVKKQKGPVNIEIDLPCTETSLTSVNVKKLFFWWIIFRLNSHKLSIQTSLYAYCTFSQQLNATWIRNFC